MDKKNVGNMFDVYHICCRAYSDVERAAPQIEKSVCGRPPQITECIRNTGKNK